MSIKQIKFLMEFARYGVEDLRFDVTPESIWLVSQIELMYNGRVTTDFDKTENLYINADDLNALLYSIVQEGEIVDTEAKGRIEKLEREVEELSSTLEMYENDLVLRIEKENQALSLA